MPTLKWQREWAGTTQVNLYRLVCWRCLDELQDQLRTVILPPDPPPVINARTENFSLDEAPTRVFLTGVSAGGMAGNLTVTHS